MSATADLLASITSPETVETRLGTLEFDDGAPANRARQGLVDDPAALQPTPALLRQELAPE